MVAALLPATLANGSHHRAVVARPVIVMVDTRPYGVTSVVNNTNTDKLAPLQYGNSTTRATRHSQLVKGYGSQPAESNPHLNNLVT